MPTAAASRTMRMVWPLGYELVNAATAWLPAYKGGRTRVDFTISSMTLPAT
jgi:hypothetical protein